MQTGMCRSGDGRLHAVAQITWNMVRNVKFLVSGSDSEVEC